jgi:hypothetical protein
MSMPRLDFLSRGYFKCCEQHVSNVFIIFKMKSKEER